MSSKAKDLEGILILGVPRSGTTLVRRLINVLPNIACPGETNVFTGCGRLLRSEEISGGVRIGILDGLAYAGFSQEEVIRRLRDFAFGFHREYAHRLGKKRWAAKTAFDIFYLEEIEQLCSDEVAYVCVVRHALDVVVSLRELCDRNGRYLRELHDYVIRNPDYFQAFVQLWVDLNERLLEFVGRHPGNSFLLRYEDLVRDPNATMHEVAEFLGEPWEEGLISAALADRSAVGLGDWKTYGKPLVDSNSVGRWRSLPRRTVALLASTCNPLLQRFGYEPVSVALEPMSRSESQRRYQLGLWLQALKSGSGAAGLLGESSKKGSPEE
ncbi:MAG: sulfotransferase [Candidatus Binatia bacterium]|nr:sulfotransferase [Candidatus Binatia bacterium]